MKTLSLKSKPILNKKGGLITSDDSIMTKLNRLNQKNFAVNISYKVASHDIQEGACVFIEDNKLSTASSLLKDSECIGVCFKSCASGEKASYITYGKSESDNYNFTAPYGKAVWVSSAGKPTDIVPNSGYLRAIGITISNKCFIVLPQSKIFTNIRDFKNKTKIPVLYNKVISYEEPDISAGSSALISQEKLSVDQPLSIVSLQQTIPSEIWIFDVNYNIANVRVLSYNGSSLLLDTQNEITMSDGVLSITFTAAKTGVVNFCVFN